MAMARGHPDYMAYSPGPGAGGCLGEGPCDLGMLCVGLRFGERVWPCLLPANTGIVTHKGKLAKIFVNFDGRR